MTVLETPPTPGTAPTSSRPRRRSGRRGVALFMAASLALSAATRFVADYVRAKALPTSGEQAASTTSLSSMNSFALGLLLGGLKGPLVMILWTDSENQKTEKDLEGVDTEIEWIRLLQPEFDTVHLFQIWNKAYNISVQMASLANKYDTILSALDYAHNVDVQKPDDINIVGAIGQLYFDKLGTSSEKNYYRRRVREETQPHAVETAARRADLGWRRVKLDPVLDDHFNVLPSLGGPEGELRYLADPQHPYGPYTDGVSTFGLAYNYYMRCAELMNDKHQHHDQLSDVVVDSRPPLTLKNWADDEVEQGRRREAQAFGTTVPDDVANPDAVTAGATLTQAVVDRAALALAIADYDRATKLVPDSLAEYERHIHNFPDRAQQYRLYMTELSAEALITAADRDFLSALTLPAGPGRDELLSAATGGYANSAVAYDLILLRYYTEPGILAKALPNGYAVLPTSQQKPIEAMRPDDVLRAAAVAEQMYPPQANEDPNGDRFEYLRRIRRAGARLQTIMSATRGHAGATVPTTAPTTAP